MILTKLEITSDLAHFKIPMTSKINKTYLIPPISTSIGILQNIYNDDIDDFVFGSSITHEGIHKEIVKIYKEINPNKKKLTDFKRFQSDIMEIEYLIKPRLLIYTNIKKSIILKDVLTLGKTDCLAKLKVSEVELKKQYIEGYNQYTPIDIGNGPIKRITTETRFNEKKGYFDIFSDMFRENKIFKCEGYYDNDEENNIILWTWRKDGKVKCL